MSAITEYIHFYQSNYDKWGINRKGTIKSDSLTASFAQIRNQIKDQSEVSILLAEAKQIEKDYNDLFFPKTPTDFSKILAEVAQETLQKQFGAAAGKINTSNFNIESNDLSQQYKKQIEEIRKKIEVANLQQTATAKQILNQIEKLSQVLLNLDNSKIDSILLNNRIQKAKFELQKIKAKIFQETGLDKKVNFSSDIQTINKLIQQFNRSFTWYNQRGDLFEWLLPLIQLKSTQLVGDELKTAMKTIVGTGNLGGAITSITFPDFLDMTNEQLSESINSKKIQMRIADVRNKTDVMIKYDIGNGKYQDLAVSAKSVTDRHIKLVEQTSLYRVLVFSKNYNFIKHYLNVISWSVKGGRAPKDQIIEANRLVKSLIMQLAAQGFDLNNPSELLIMHNVKERKINVYNIKVLVYLIKNQIMAGNNKYSNLIKIKGSTFEDDFTIQQQFETTVEQRLNNLLNEINNIKITAHIYGTQLDNYLELLEKT